MQHALQREPLVRADVVDAAGIAALDACAWERLSRAALCENPFYARPYMLAALETIDRDAALKAVCVTDEWGDLIGLFPYRVRPSPPLFWNVAHGAANLYQFSGHPLVMNGRAGEAVGAWLDAMASGLTPPLWLFSDFGVTDELKFLIERECAVRGMVAAVAMPYRRAQLTRVEGGFTAHCADIISKKRVRDIQRNLRRLSEQGELSFERAFDPADVEQRIEQFLVLEASGWKGTRGTAFLSNEDHALFARRAFVGMGTKRSGCTVDSLLLDGEPIAISVNISTGATAFTPKCAYDERWRKYGPGLILEYFVIEQFYEQADFARMDAATGPDGHVIDGLWNAGKTLGSLIVGPANWRTQMLADSQARLHTCKQIAKRAIGRR